MKVIKILAAGVLAGMWVVGCDSSKSNSATNPTASHASVTTVDNECKADSSPIPDEKTEATEVIPAKRINSTLPDSLLDETKYFVRPYRILSSFDTVGEKKAVRVITYKVPEDTIVTLFGYTTGDIRMGLMIKDLATDVTDTVIMDRNTVLKHFRDTTKSNDYDPRFYNNNHTQIWCVDKPRRYDILSADTVSLRIMLCMPDTDQDLNYIYRRWNDGDTIWEIPIIMTEDSWFLDE